MTEKLVAYRITETVGTDSDKYIGKKVASNLDMYIGQKASTLRNIYREKSKPLVPKDTPDDYIFTSTVYGYAFVGDIMTIPVTVN